ncbi:ParB/RepB/Spo0J family partition protein [Brevundimonas aurifodinae]|uniref:Chromosome partitioning protein ParB n=1 Tax=Brevundimonas aurifodinae TaxID=1508312 RepID=A0ABV1NKM8_9CAUL
MIDLASATWPAGPRIDRDERTVRLGDLAVAPENLRYGEAPDDDLPTLAATIRAAGVLQRLTVRPGRGRKEKAWMALDGRRRLLALGHLLDAGDIDADHPVDVVVETDPGRQAAAVLLTNTAVPVHIADVIAAIGRMMKSRLTVPAIARALGYEPLEIKRLAALAALPSVALVALKSGRINLKQARLLARLAEPAEQAEIAQAALDGHGFRDWQILERLDEGRVTGRDRRCALVDPAAYGAAGGRTEVDLFGELAPVLLDPGVLTDLWTRRVHRIAAAFETRGLEVHVTADPEPDLPDDLEAVGYVYGNDLTAEEMARYRAQRDRLNERAEAVEVALADPDRPDAADRAIIDMVHARLEADQTGCGGRAVTTLLMWPSARTGIEVRCYAPRASDIEPAGDGDETRDAGAASTAAAYAPPEVETPEPQTEGVNHALHAVRTDVATRGLIRALADDPGAALTALIARLFNVLVRRAQVARSEAAVTVLATAFNPADGRVIEALDGDVRRRLDQRRLQWEASGETVMGWIHRLAHGEKMALLAELTAISLDVREARTSLIRRSARAEAAELAALCGADITLHWTPDAPFLQAHAKPLLIGMLEAMGVCDDRAATLKKTELVDWVAAEAAARTWAPAGLSWTVRDSEAAGTAPEGERVGEAVRGQGPESGLDEGTGAFVVTPAGEAALAAAFA